MFVLIIIEEGGPHAIKSKELSVRIARFDCSHISPLHADAAAGESFAYRDECRDGQTAQALSWAYCLRRVFPLEAARRLGVYPGCYDTFFP